METVWIVDALSGTRLERIIPVAAGAWESKVNGVGEGAHVFRLAEAENKLSPARWRDITRPWARILVVEVDGQPEYGGWITNRKWNLAKQTLTVKHAEFRAILARRMNVTVGDYALGTVELSGASLRGLARDVVRNGTSGGSTRWNLRVRLPPLEIGSESRTWFNHQFMLIEDMLTDVQNTHFGPDIAFQPAWDAGDGKFWWDMRIGTPRLSAHTHEFHATTGALMDHEIEEDARKQLTGVFTVGEGSGADIAHGEAGLDDADLPAGLPWLDARREYKSIGTRPELDALADSELATYSTPTEQPTGSVLRKSLSAPMWPGDRVIVNYPGDKFLDPSKRHFYVVAVQGSHGTNKVGITIQEAA